MEGRHDRSQMPDAEGPDPHRRRQERGAPPPPRGMVPAIAYGKGLPTTAIAVRPKDVTAVLKSERGRNTVVELDMEGEKMLAMIKDSRCTRSSASSSTWTSSR